MTEKDARDRFDLARFVAAQAQVFERACAELEAGRKQSHWMWFIFPQIAGLGRSPTAQYFAISGRAEAQDYLSHPVLGQRLRRCAEIVNAVQGRSAHEIFGAPDDLKFQSSMTLFAAVADDNQIFREPLRKYFAGEMDAQTLQRL